ncbi:MAG: lipopolysaccharide biosynthesis protein, partial [Chloroflexi bacterium]
MVDSRRIGKAVFWNALDLLTRSGLKLVVLVVLARWLRPADFGLFAMLAIFVAIAQLLIESGFSQALIQRQDSTHADESSIFFFNLMMGAVVAVLLCLASPGVAAFYAQPLLEPMTCWMALNLFINTFGGIHTALLQKELDFETLTKVGFFATLVSSGVALGMAASGWGVWSLVGQVLANTIVSVILLWLLHAWRPTWMFSFATLRSYFRFGGWLLWTSLLYVIYTNLYAMMIGKLHAVQDVGYYTQARRLQQIPINIVTSMAGRVSFPVYASVAADKQKLARGLSKATRAVVFVTLPLMLAIM